ncbi:hypothetical protein LP419_32225 [Massilia sp. H-1]|nr:hypothetical protein LP419_32225 [Massilia sp. H-1]
MNRKNDSRQPAATLKRKGKKMRTKLMRPLLGVLAVAAAYPLHAQQAPVAPAGPAGRPARPAAAAGRPRPGRHRGHDRRRSIVSRRALGGHGHGAPARRPGPAAG